MPRTPPIHFCQRGFSKQWAKTLISRVDESNVELLNQLRYSLCGENLKICSQKQSTIPLRFLGSRWSLRFLRAAIIDCHVDMILMFQVAQPIGADNYIELSVIVLGLFFVAAPLTCKTSQGDLNKILKTCYDAINETKDDCLRIFHVLARIIWHIWKIVERLKLNEEWERSCGETKALSWKTRESWRGRPATEALASALTTKLWPRHASVSSSTRQLQSTRKQYCYSTVDESDGIRLSRRSPNDYVIVLLDSPLFIIGTEYRSNSLYCISKICSPTFLNIRPLSTLRNSKVRYSEVGLSRRSPQFGNRSHSHC